MSEALAGGRYTVVRRVAQGGMGEVLLASFGGDAALGLSEGLVVLKRVLTEHPSYKQQATMLREEGRLGLRLLHENLVETFFVDEHMGDPMLVMEFLSGRAMSQVLAQAKKRRERIPIDLALGILRAAACGLHFAHTLTHRGRPLGLIHRDVSPANIFVTFDGRVKVIDFGVAKAEDSEIRTSTGILKGKIGYMAPEHALGDPLTPAADLWSLGVCFWETLCAERLFARPSPSATVQAITEQPIPSPRVHRPELPKHIESLCMALLQRRTGQRLATGRALVDEIDALPEAASLPRLDIGAWLSGRFPEEAEAGEREARRAARLRLRVPVSLGLVEGTATAGPSEEEAPTIVMSAARGVAEAAPRAPDEAAEIAEDAATVRMKLSEIPRDVDEDAATSRINVANLLADAEEKSGLRSAEHSTDEMPRERSKTLSDPAIAAPQTGSGAEPWVTVSVLTPMPRAPSSKTVGASTVTVPLVEKPASWITVAFLTFGVLALAMGVAFSFLAPPPAMGPLYAYPDAARSYDTVVAQRDAPPGARPIDPARPRLLVQGQERDLEAGDFAMRLEHSGLAKRASLPATPRATLAALLPLLIAGVGVLALAGTVPVLIIRGRRSRILAQVLLIVLASAFVGAVVLRGALSWPGMESWERPARLEMK
jgi:serine/threonine protein kinase